MPSLFSSSGTKKKSPEQGIVSWIPFGPWQCCIAAWIVTIVLLAHNIFHHATRPVPLRTNWALRMDKTIEAKYLSQGNQDGIVEYIFHHIGTANKYYVEFGFDATAFELGIGPNTAHLHIHYGWTGLLMDGTHQNASINLQREFITPESIVQLFQKYRVPYDADYVSIDLDTTDLWIFRALITSGKFRPRVITTEYNCNLPFNSTVAYPTSGMFWNGTKVMGSSFGAFHAAATEGGYTVVYVLPCLDIFYVRNDILARTTDTFPASHWAPATGLALHHPATQEEVARLLEYHTFVKTGDKAAAEAAAQLQMQEQGVNLTLHNHLGSPDEPSSTPAPTTPPSAPGFLDFLWSGSDPKEAGRKLLRTE